MKRSWLKSVMGRAKYILPSKISSQIMFFKKYHRFIDYKNPRLMDEKLMIIKQQYENRSDIKNLVDKYTVREFLTEGGYGQILNEIYQVCDLPEQIVWETLPPKFVIKCNHGCGYNIIVEDSSMINKEEINKTLKSWLTEDYAMVFGEKQYHGIKRRIIIEKFIEMSDGHFPPDYKFFVSYGKVIGCMVVVERDIEHKRFFVDSDFRDLKFIHEYSKDDYDKYRPASWRKMLELSSGFGKDFPFVRVDLYDFNGNILFGEFTFTPNGCIHEQFSREGQLYIGKRIRLNR